MKGVEATVGPRESIEHRKVLPRARQDLPRGKQTHFRVP